MLVAPPATAPPIPLAPATPVANSPAPAPAPGGCGGGGGGPVIATNPGGGAGKLFNAPSVRAVVAASLAVLATSDAAFALATPSLCQRFAFSQIPTLSASMVTGLT